MSANSHQAHVTIERRRLWSLRISLGATRWVLYAVALVGVASAARNAVAPPRAQRIPAPAPRRSDTAGEWFALSFARAYLTWSADPSTHEAVLRPFLDAVEIPTSVWRRPRAAPSRSAGSRSPASGRAGRCARLHGRGGNWRRRRSLPLRGRDQGAGRGGGSRAIPGARRRRPRLPARQGSTAPGCRRSPIPRLSRCSTAPLRNYVDSSTRQPRRRPGRRRHGRSRRAGSDPAQLVRLAVEPSGAVLATRARRRRERRPLHARLRVHACAGRRPLGDHADPVMTNRSGGAQG